jgi:cupin fold WbuC family metalloprotein
MTTSFTGQDIIEIRTGQLAALKKAADAAPLRRARLCLHHSHEDAVQEMVIAFHRDTYNRPHRHRGKSESFHVIEGHVVIVFLDDDGVVTRKVYLGPPGSGLPFIYRLSSSRWHTVIPLDDHVVIHETTTGPFEPGQTEFAPFAPDGADRELATRYIGQLLHGLTHPAREGQAAA